MNMKENAIKIIDNGWQNLLKTEEESKYKSQIIIIVGNALSKKNV